VSHRGPTLAAHVLVQTLLMLNATSPAAYANAVMSKVLFGTMAVTSFDKTDYSRGVRESDYRIPIETLLRYVRMRTHVPLQNAYCIVTTTRLFAIKCDGSSNPLAKISNLPPCLRSFALSCVCVCVCVCARARAHGPQDDPTSSERRGSMRSSSRDP
jgi:hypothetical protein